MVSFLCINLYFPVPDTCILYLNRVIPCMFIYNIRLSAFIYLYAPTDMLTIESYFRFTDTCLHSEIA